MAETPQRARALRALAESDLRARVDAVTQQLWQERIRAKAGTLQHTSLLKTLRRQRARLLTLLHEQAGRLAGTPAHRGNG